MTIEEAIQHCEEVAKEQENLWRVCPASENELFLCDGSKDCTTLANGKDKGCLKCAAEYRQLAEWLKDYKMLIEQKHKTGHWIEGHTNNANKPHEILVIEYNGTEHRVQCQSFEFRTNQVSNWIRIKHSDGSTEVIHDVCVVKAESEE